MNDGDSFSEVCYDCFDRTKETAKRIILWFPVFMLMAIAIYTYYVYVVAFSTNFLIYGNPSHKTRGALYIAFFNLMLVVFLTCYLVTVFMSPGRPLDVDDLFIREPVEGEPFEPQKGEDGKTWLNSQVTRYCIKCSYVKPDRAHHCSVCDQCCLKMDHHCVWLNNCVGWRNYHMFMLTLLYGSVGAMFVAITLGQQMIYDAANKSLFINEIQYLIATLFSFLLGASAAGLFFFHISLISKNMTTIEHLDKQDAFRKERRQRRARVATVTPVSKASPFLLSPMMANFKAVLGPRPWLWWVPFSYRPESRAGLYFPRVSHEVPDSYSA